MQLVCNGVALGPIRLDIRLNICLNIRLIYRTDMARSTLSMFYLGLLASGCIFLKPLLLPRCLVRHASAIRFDSIGSFVDSVEGVVFVAGIGILTRKKMTTTTTRGLGV